MSEGRVGAIRQATNPPGAGNGRFQPHAILGSGGQLMRVGSGWLAHVQEV
jgi:hypothetical protein